MNIPCRLQLVVRCVTAAVVAVSTGAAIGDGADPTALRRAMQERFRAVVDQVRPSLVRIDTVGGTQPSDGRAPIEDSSTDEPEGRPRHPRRQNPFTESTGSGFVVADGPTTGLVYSADGYVVSSSFNFAREPALISVTLSDGRRVAADLVARDQVRKVALLKLDATGLTPARWVDLDDVTVGQTAIALGLGFGGASPSITAGIVSAKNRMRGNALQTDAKLSPANYGGPLCDLEGRVIGLCVPMAQRPGELAGAEMYDSGVGFVVPKVRLDAIVAGLKEGRSAYRGWLGMSLNPKVPNAVVVGAVADPSPMLRAGIVPGDRIIMADGRRVKHFGHLMQALYMIPAGETVALGIERDGQEFSVSVPLARNTELGKLPEAVEPFDPSTPVPEEQPEQDHGEGGGDNDDDPD